MRYGYQQVKVARHFGEKDDLQDFLNLCNDRGYVIEQALDVGNGYFVFIYSFSE